jgi:hypothetical protein
MFLYYFERAEGVLLDLEEGQSISHPNAYHQILSIRTKLHLLDRMLLIEFRDLLGVEDSKSVMIEQMHFIARHAGDMLAMAVQGPDRLRKLVIFSHSLVVDARPLENGMIFSSSIIISASNSKPPQLSTLMRLHEAPNLILFNLVDRGTGSTDQQPVVEKIKGQYAFGKTEGGQQEVYCADDCGALAGVHYLDEAVVAA